MILEDDSSNQALPMSLAREIARQGEIKLAATLQIGIAADMRATTMCGIFGALAVGLAAAVLTALATDQHFENLAVAGAVSAFAFFLAALVAGSAALPEDFHVPGSEPGALRTWAWTGTNWCDEETLLDGIGSRTQDFIILNRAALERSARIIHAALYIAAFAPLLGVATFFIRG